MASTDRWVVLAVALGAFMPLPFVWIVEMFPPELAATAAGVTNAACFAGGMILPIVLGRVVDVTGSFGAAFLVAAAVQGIALIIGVFMVETGAPAYTPQR